MSNEKNLHLKKLLKEYYTELYKNQLGLKNYQERVTQRLDEENIKSYYSASREINLIKTIINYSFKNKAVLIVGAGTGLELFQLKDQGANVYGIEPEKKAIEILKLKASKFNLEQKKIVKGVAEKLPYKNGQFDFIYCWQVLEHVQNLEKSIQEMIRVTKKDGWLFFGCPDYRHLVEPHYKMYLPLFLPKIIIKIMLILSGRKIKFFNSLQFVTSKRIRRVLTANLVTGLKIIKPYQNKNRLNLMGKMILWLQDCLEIEQTQLWLVKKT